MSKSVSHGPRTIAYYEKQGFVCAKVERWVTFGGGTRAGFGRSPGHRVDLFGCIDIVAMDVVGKQTWGIQYCGKQYPEHVRKVLAEPRAQQWLLCGNRLVLVAWEKRKGETKRMHWTPRFHEFTLAEFGQKEEACQGSSSVTTTSSSSTEGSASSPPG